MGGVHGNCSRSTVSFSDFRNLHDSILLGIINEHFALLLRRLPARVSLAVGHTTFVIFHILIAERRKTSR